MHRAFLGTSRPRLAIRRSFLAMHRPRLAIRRSFLAMHRPFLATRRASVRHRHPKRATLPLVLTTPRQSRGSAVSFSAHRDALAAIPKGPHEARCVLSPCHVHMQ
jgi:hypothetical protein